MSDNSNSVGEPCSISLMPKNEAIGQSKVGSLLNLNGVASE